MVSTRAKSRKGLESQACEQEIPQSVKSDVSHARHVRFESPSESESTTESLFQSRNPPLTRDGGYEPAELPFGTGLRGRTPPLTRGTLVPPENLETELGNAVNRRLEAARTFLSTQEVSHTWGFESQYEQIDDFLRMLSDKKIPCDLQLYETVRLMVKVHHGHISKQSGVIVPYGERKDFVISHRLPTTDPVQRVTTAMALRREDHPPFSIKAHADDAQFFRELNGDDDIGEMLRLNQRKAYTKGLFDTGFAAKKGPEEAFDERATERGRQAAALQIALQSFAGGLIQHYGDQDHRVMDFPKEPVPDVVDPVLSSSASDSMRRATEQLRKRKCYDKDGMQQSNVSDDLDYEEIWSFSRNRPPWSANRNFFSLQFWSGFNQDNGKEIDFDPYDPYNLARKTPPPFREDAERERECKEDDSNMSRPNRKSDIFGGIKTSEADFVTEDRTSRHGRDYDPEKFHHGHSGASLNPVWVSEEPSMTAFDSIKPPSAKPAHAYTPSRLNFPASRNTANFKPPSRTPEFGAAAYNPSLFHHPEGFDAFQSQCQGLRPPWQSAFRPVPGLAAPAYRPSLFHHPEGFNFNSFHGQSSRNPTPDPTSQIKIQEVRPRPPFQPVPGIDDLVEAGSLLPKEILNWDGKIPPGIPVIGVDTDPEESHASEADDVSVVSASVDGSVSVSVRGDDEEEKMAFERISIRGDDSNDDEPMPFGPGTLLSVGVRREGWNASGSTPRTRSRSGMPPPERPATATANANASVNPFAEYRERPPMSSTTDNLTPYAIPRIPAYDDKSASEDQGQDQDQDQDQGYGGLMPPEIMAWEGSGSTTPPARRNLNPFVEAEGKFVPASDRSRLQPARPVSAARGKGAFKGRAPAFGGGQEWAADAVSNMARVQQDAATNMVRMQREAATNSARMQRAMGMGMGRVVGEEDEAGAKWVDVVEGRAGVEDIGTGENRKRRKGKRA